jgi:hypothetical protein
MRRNPQLKAMGARTAIGREPLRLFRRGRPCGDFLAPAFDARPTTDQARLRVIMARPSRGIGGTKPADEDLEALPLN